jgi:hypothetical protein
MKDKLLIYRAQARKTEIDPMLDLHKEDNIVLLVEDEIQKNVMKYLTKDYSITNNFPSTFNIKTYEELFNGELNQFNFINILGNPAYQYPKGLGTQKKLYLDITTDIIPLLDMCGILGPWIVPQNILIPNSKKKKIDNFLTKHLSVVDYSVNKDFNIGQNICSIIADKNKTGGKIKIIDVDGREFFVDDVMDSFPKELRDFISIMQKVSIRFTERPKLKISQTNNRNAGVHPSEVKNIKTVNYKNKLISSNKKDKFTYKDNSFVRIVIPYSGIFTECLVGDYMVDYGFYSTPPEYYTVQQLENMQTYMESKLIRYLLIGYSSSYNKKQTYDFLRELPEIDLFKNWTDEELYDFFKLTKEEKSVIESWNRVYDVE